MAKPGYGKRAAPGQPPSRTADFALLPDRERYVAGFIDRLPDGAAMDVKSLAKQLPLYGQQAVGSALRYVAAAGHLRRVRCLVSVMGQFRWVFRTFWSRTARTNEWWATAVESLPGVIKTVVTGVRDFVGGLVSEPLGEPVEGEDVPRADAPSGPDAPDATAVPAGPAPTRASGFSDPPQEAAVTTACAPPSTPSSRASSLTPDLPAPGLASPAAVPVPPAPPQQRTPASGGHSTAYLALANLGRIDSRLPLSAADCAVLEGLAAGWLARGVNTDYLTQALTAGLPPQVDSPVGFVRRRLTDKIPPHVSAAPDPAAPGAPVRPVLVECAKCAAPGRPEALPDGLCRPCRTSAQGGAAAGGAAPEPALGLPSERDVRAFAADLRVLLKSP
ncbi:MarR family transcriptional regulator [Streptomyces sp. NPDC057428]|uniref:MarR family transcriptional regulator n=1 Tax=Streptomyces sp. NPDC057428 TaxID=3346129 RepID=UPI003678DC33